MLVYKLLLWMIQNKYYGTDTSKEWKAKDCPKKVIECMPPGKKKQEEQS
jgi:hypothetical protein